MANEKRLIDANAFRDFWNKNYRHQYANDNFLVAIVNFPTVDAVEVVRCKDCTEWDEKEQECKHWYGFHADDFCSHGEREDRRV